MKNKNFLGTGIAFPFSVGDNGQILTVSNERSVENSIRIILGTTKGERLMRPDFGCDLNNLVFSPNGARTYALAQHYIEEALHRWEHRIVLEEVLVAPDADDETRINISIQYKIRSINTYFNLVYPFYLERGESDTQSQFG
ncbi:GPW/gp25 family protein [Sediminispirochaeta bajacaliforniensis]|uniref:GPW/gp25 family protein n=1 Tax=Sediminispirochaeta bajacaliforniensis TaxID=148 RepID=UPI00037EF081|nr:GPW/gp25 family protein [Sediminispirochaeta bajacaliforniensis]